MKINVLGQNYEVTDVKKKKMPKKTLGVCNSTTNQICLSTELKGEKRNEVLLHEMIHACSEMLDMGLTEKQVNNLAVSLLPYIDVKKLVCSVTKED